MVLGSCTTVAIIAFVIVRIMNELLGWPRRERERTDIRR